MKFTEKMLLYLLWAVNSINCQEKIKAGIHNSLAFGIVFSFMPLSGEFKRGPI